MLKNEELVWAVLRDFENSPLDDKHYRPAPERPLVYHLFGHLREKEPDLVVLTEDNYFDYLIGVHKNKGVIHKNLAARKKSQLARLLNSKTKPTTAAAPAS